MPNRFLSTGEAAKHCSVTPDTVLKWIKSGRLPSRRTAGGHYRINPEDLRKLLSSGRQSTADRKRTSNERHIRYCWEYNGVESLLDDCAECIVYQLRARRCYEVKFASDIDHGKLNCSGKCEECEYYHNVREQATNVLVVTNNEALIASLKQDAELAPYRLRVTECEYKCSALVQEFRPDYVVLDCSLGDEASRDICHHLIQDTRIPYVRVIMAANMDEFPGGCDKEVFARIGRPFGITEITQCIHDAAV
jgi:excisionase family DNA binding protein